MRLAGCGFVLIGLAMGVACSGPPMTEEDAVKPAAPVIEVSNAPLAYVAERLVGSAAEVRFRMATVDDPAYWRPAADDVIAMQEADLIILNGAEYEHWLKDVSLPPSKIVDTTSGLNQRLLNADQSLTHSHGLEGEHEHGGTAFTTWLDLTVFVEQSRAVAEALGRLIPEEAGAIVERLTSLEADLLALDATIEAAVAEAPTVVFSHPVYQYFQHRYRLVGASVHWEPDVPPTPDQWRELDHIVGHDGAGLMLWEAEPLTETREGLERRGLAVVVFDPCAALPAEGTWLENMHRNATALQSAVSR